MSSPQFVEGTDELLPCAVLDDGREAVDVDELIWHRDREDREITVIRSNGWYLQMDDELPVSMHPGDVFHIPKEKWHRVIRKGNNDLVVEIKVVQT